MKKLNSNVESGGESSSSNNFDEPNNGELTEVEKKRHERFKSLRDRQEREANRRLTRSDVLFFVAIGLATRKALLLVGISPKRFVTGTALSVVAWILYRGRHPQKILPLNAGDFPVWPILGQVLQGKQIII